MYIPLQQTKKWQKLQSELGEISFFEENDNFSFLAILKHTSVGDYLFCPYGPVLKNKQTMAKALEALKKLAKEKSAIFIRIEPTMAFTGPEMAKYGLKKSKDLDPADTWVLDLTAPKSEILTNFSQGTRTRYNNFAKKGLTVEISHNPTDIKYLVNLQHSLAKIKKIGTFSENYLETEFKQPFASLYLVHYQNIAEKTHKIISASLFFDHAGTRYYMQSATDENYKKLPATVALLATSIFDAQAKGLKKFDFWGIAPDNAPQNHPWAGFTAFKKSFGGYAVHYSGTYDLVLQPTKYRVYSLFRAINHSVRKLKNR